MNWTAELLNKVENFCHSGYTNAQIASKLKDDGLFVTKNAVKHVCTEHHFSRGNRLNGDHGNSNSNEQESVEQDIDYNDDQTIRNARITYRYMSFRDKKKKSPKQILKYAGYDPDKWILVSAHPNEWTVTSANEVPKWNFQFKISIKPKTNNDLSTDDLIKLFNEKIEPIKLIKSGISGKHNLVIACSDFHFGITKFKDVQNRLVELIDLIHRGWKQIVITQLGDLLHSDALNTSKTTKGTELDPIDFVQAVRDAERFIFPIIEESYKYSDEMQMFNINGNHDETTSFMFQEMLRAKYPQMDIKVNNSYREAFVIGKSVGLLALHGHAGKVKAPMLFATEYPDIWSKSTYRMVLYGHFHKEVVNDDFGVVEHQVGTFKTTDPYESKNGYTMATKKMECFEFDDQTLKDIHYI
ncbi:conserved protein of unknown function [Oenococcus oeni]|uniref:hypothetical protein n=1 Tax=Oenococcus oeni TaxID=1247 RepID=UPI00107B419C|nr:hypothetical protein [Oenococcus oeni]AVI94092.1 hypothetical protein AX764_04260 [Oenococcus oeni]SYV99712.1 conserved hypothetical protein [Oenococcus oeni]SYW03889.1 conserved hypothetical protein [Oenococcus oeni]SYW17666.1 conserved hypothetical protein [Oenococcus oeni]VDC14609.1 conserved protein of unknown function [Oenococcus oeni]